MTIDSRGLLATPRRALLVGALVVAAACSGAGGSLSAAPSVPATAASETSSPSTEPSAEPVELTIFGAASLAKALEAVRSAYEAAVPGVTLTLSSDSSAALATQIAEGAPADVFLSADTANPQKLIDGALADGSAVVFAGNELTIITPLENPGGVTGPFDLAKAGLTVIAAGDEVPITRYATQLVDNLASAPDAPDDFADEYAANIASREDNVAAVRTKIELGEGDAAIVYVTDAAASELVTVVEVPPAVNVPSSYAGVVVKASADIEAGHAFLDWLAGAEGQAVMSTFGFLPPAS